jgi:protein-disulfide isomerase
MNNTFRIIFLLLVTTVISSISYAQDNTYEDIPQSRTEDGGFVLGNPEATVKVIEFADFLCPHCQDYTATIDTFIEDFVVTGQAQFEYRMYPVVDANLSAFSAGLVECANIQSEGLFWQAHDVMYDLTSTSQFSQETITQFADTLSLDADALSECAATATQVLTDSNYGNDLGITGTPSIAVQYDGGDPIFLFLPSPDQFSSIVNASRPTASDPVTIESGRYEGIQTYRTDDGGIVLGDPDAPLTIVAFEDFMCPHCQAYQETIHTFVENHVATGQAKFEYRFFPLVNPDYSMLTAQVAECVALQDLGKFWDAHDLLFDFATTGDIDSEVASVVAMIAGVDADAVVECVDTSIQPLIDLQLGQVAGVRGTPGIRARNASGDLDIIYSGQQSLESGGVPIGALSALAEGSGSLTIGQPEPTLLNDSWLDDDSIITGEPCSAPCWQNITTNETTIDEAHTIVEQLATAAILEESPNGFTFSVGSDAVCCQIGSQDGNVVSTIFLQLAPTNTLGEVIEVYSEPTAVSGEPFTESEHIITLFYADLNLAVYVIVEGADGQLSDESPIISVIYIDDALMTSIIADGTLKSWDGYLTYNDYVSN